MIWPSSNCFSRISLTASRVHMQRAKILTCREKGTMKISAILQINTIELSCRFSTQVAITLAIPKILNNAMKRELSQNSQGCINKLQ